MQVPHQVSACGGWEYVTVVCATILSSRAPFVCLALVLVGAISSSHYVQCRSPLFVVMVYRSFSGRKVTLRRSGRQILALHYQRDQRVLLALSSSSGQVHGKVQAWDFSDQRATISPGAFCEVPMAATKQLDFNCDVRCNEHGVFVLDGSQRLLLFQSWCANRKASITIGSKVACLGGGVPLDRGNHLTSSAFDLVYINQDAKVCLADMKSSSVRDIHVEKDAALVEKLKEKERKERERARRSKVVPQVALKPNPNR